MDSAATKRLEFNSICRLCTQLLETENVSPIFNNEIYAERVTLPERIRYCSSVEVCEGDGLPNNICSSCLLKLNQSFVFRNQCVLADNTLKKLVRDVTISMTEVSRFLNVDIESQVIQLENASVKMNLYNSDTEILNPGKKVAKSGKNVASIDEFDNSKNGRHKRNINRSNDRSIQRAKICKSETTKLSDLNVEFSYETDTDGNSSSDEEVLERRPKRKRMRIKGGRKNENKVEERSDTECLWNESRNKAKRSRKVRGRKIGEEDVEIKEEIKEEVDEVQDIVENFTVEPDVFHFGETKKEFEEGSSEKEVKKVDHHRQMKKMSEEGSACIKRGRPRKYSAMKEKPSSYTCDYCQKVYPSEGGWRYHIHTMHNENYQPFICDLCGKAFKVKKNLEGHKNSIHYHLKHHLCDLCGRGFASKYALKVHKIWHNDEKNFPCDICGTKFRTRGKMNTHRSIHGGPKKFMCHVCSRDFRWKKDFEIHMRTHTGEKPFKCSHCGKAFSSLTNMKKHERNHIGKIRTNRIPDAFDEAVPDMQPDELLYKAELPFQYECGAEEDRSDQFR
ncbi:UNVERIFIED_CONTAM: hypothetical protein PYX00_008893 [Menopon gallinae]|uniref:Uncharacterized protein n=1 Tax=Menopon gallinae TaxID=328185 RepID=A0AAW2H910_9NEOP